MLKKLMDILRKGDLVDQAIKDTDMMFQHAKKIYQEAIGTLFEQREAHFDIYKADRNINNLEKDIRRKILENMAINPRQDIVASLVLTSIIIDIERIGDYSKNIYELTKLCLKNKNIQIDERLKKDANFILEQFTAVMDALSAGDDKQGQKIMDLLDPIRKGFDQYINAAISDETNTVCSAVVNSLFSRYLKRVGAHLENISSSIANPFDKIGFYKNKNKETEIE